MTLLKWSIYIYISELQYLSFIPRRQFLKERVEKVHGAGRDTSAVHVLTLPTSTHATMMIIIIVDYAMHGIRYYPLPHGGGSPGQWNASYTHTRKNNIGHGQTQYIGHLTLHAHEATSSLSVSTQQQQGCNTRYHNSYSSTVVSSSSSWSTAQVGTVVMIVQTNSSSITEVHHT